MSAPEAKCDKMWKKAKEAIKKQSTGIQNDFEESSILRITEKNVVYFCYKKSNFIDKGWCLFKEPYVPYTGYLGWGICSDSCRFVGKDEEEVEEKS